MTPLETLIAEVRARAEAQESWTAEDACDYFALTSPANLLRILDQFERMRGALDEVAKHVQYLRHVEKRYAEVGKTKYDFAKMNGPLSAIERAISAARQALKGEE